MLLLAKYGNLNFPKILKILVPQCHSQRLCVSFVWRFLKPSVLKYVKTYREVVKIIWRTPIYAQCSTFATFLPSLYYLSFNLRVDYVHHAPLPVNIFKEYLKQKPGNSLVVQWLGLVAFIARAKDQSSAPD